MSILYPNMTFLVNSLTPALGGLNPPCLSLRVGSIVDDTNSKVKELQNQSKAGIEGTKAQIISEADAFKSKLTSSTGRSAAPKGSLELYSTKYYAASVVAGILACGITHALVTPLDLVKCRRQPRSTGVGPTLAGYSVQGACKYGFYEYFKKTYSDLAGPENAVKYKDAIYLAGSASAEFIADAAYVPFEAVKVRMQTTIPPFATGMTEAFTNFTAVEGTSGLYKSLGSLWSRQIPYTMMKFWSFEATVTKIYASLGKPKDSYNKMQQLGVSFVGGYIAGVFCAIVSHPADTMVSKLNAVGKEGSAKPSVGSIYKEIGFSGLWAGLGTRVFMIGTLTALQWLIYDYVKVAFGFPTTGAAEPKKN